MTHRNTAPICSGDLVYRSPRGATPFNPGGFRTVLATAVKAAGITHGSAQYSLRHSFASRLAAKNVDAFTIARLLGHTTTTMSAGYVHRTAGERDRVVDALRRS
jgi:site-specific recombinase XerD